VKRYDAADAFADGAGAEGGSCGCAIAALLVFFIAFGAFWVLRQNDVGIFASPCDIEATRLWHAGDPEVTKRMGGPPDMLIQCVGRTDR
jgi:hypothetical protein